MSQKSFRDLFEKETLEAPKLSKKIKVVIFQKDPKGKPVDEIGIKQKQS
jgi:hypothetical protein